MADIAGIEDFRPIVEGAADVFDRPCNGRRRVQRDGQNGGATRSVDSFDHLLFHRYRHA
jgi:hypothetical protein